MAENVNLEIFVKMAVSSWETQNIRVTKLLNSLTDEQLLSETAPGRNRGIYLIGHLAAVSDGLLTLMEWGERLHPERDVVFVKNADKSGTEMPSVEEVRAYWSKVCAMVAKHIGSMQLDDWFQKHTTVAAEDFAKEPHRNKLNVLINRTNHMSYHLGQLIYLEKK
ncbi:MAG: DinB family protein [Bacteroidota bacterium]